MFDSRKLLKKCGTLFAVFYLLFGTAKGVIAAPILSFNNSQTNISEIVYVGDTITLELWFSGFDTIDVGGFQFLLNFNDTVTSLATLEKNDTLTEFDIYDVFNTGNAVDSYAVAFADDLSSQADAFKIATLSFLASNVGISELLFSDLIVSDENAQAIDLTMFQGQIAVIDNTNISVPAPTSLSIFLLGLFVISIRRIDI